MASASRTEMAQAAYFEMMAAAAKLDVMELPLDAHQGQPTDTTAPTCDLVVHCKIPKPTGITLRQNSFRGLPAWQLRIIRKHPSIYLVPSPENKKTFAQCPERMDTLAFCNLRFGFECDQGWSAIIEDISVMAVTLVEKLRSSGLQTSAAITACIVKEKFGKLTWQGNDNLEQPFRALWFAYLRQMQERSTRICERCGRHGQLREVGNWFTTLCDEAYREKPKADGSTE